MKQRFSSLDLQVIAHELSTTLTPSHRLTNIYDITTRIFLLKFSKPSSKHLLLIDSGFRCHLTTFARGTSPKQSPFVAKLRKCLRTRRCTAVRQVASDRVLEFVFSEGAYRLYLEFYAGGNVVLVDREGTIVALLREVKGGEGGVGECRVGAKYEVSTRTAEGVLRERIIAALEASLENEDAAAAAATTSLPSQGAGRKYKKKAKRKGGDEMVKKVLSARMPEFAPALIEHCFRTTGVDVDVKAEDALADEETLDGVVRALEAAEGMIRDIMADVNGTGIKGYIIAKAPRAPAENTGGYKKDKAADKKKKGVSFGGGEDEPEAQQQQQQSAFGTTEAVESEQPEKVQEEGEAKGMVYDDFFPFLPIQYFNAPGIKTVECHGYNTTVDSFFSSIESQKSDSRITTMRENAVKRLDAARTDHHRRVEGLRTLQEINTAKAQAIEANLDRVEEVIASVNGLVAKGMDWVAMDQLIDVERKRGNPVAELIKLPLKLAENTVTVTLPEVNYDDEEGEEESDDSADETDEEGEDDAAAPTKPKKVVKTLDIDIDLSLTGYANASSYFTQKKVLLVKESKTIQSSTKALKSTEKKIQTDLQKALKHEKDVLRPVRAQHWFEKFLFFISSDGLMVLAGRDLQQNEILYRRYFRRGDVYVSADIEGAAMVVIKNNPATPGAPIPPSTLTQAGTLAVATSRAWDAKSGMSAWWVTHEQVGKMVRGEYLDTGRFEIKGAKNFLPPAQLILGFGVMWYVDEESRRRHGKHRLGEKEKEQEEETTAANPTPAEPAGEKVDGPGDGRENLDDDDDDEAETEAEESSDEEFPDAQIESAGEEEEAQEEAAPEADADTEPKAQEQEQDSDLDEDDDRTTTTTTTDRADTPSGSKHMSAKDRRELRKARLGGGGATNNDIPAAATTSAKPAPPKPVQAQVRGKKGKAKKLATKYAHQDAEDRALAMSLLGSAAAAKADDAAATKAAKDEEAAFQKARRREQHARAAREAMMAEEARLRDDDEDDETVSIPLDAFVGMPMAGDVLLDAVPVCAPWGAMGKFKYRVKMQPGTVKKGKAVKEIVGKWLAEGEKKKSVDGEVMWPAERELIKGWREAEIINCVGVSKVKIFSAGGDAAADKKRGPGGGGGGGKRGGKGGKRK
ncbi:uncharacterized protein H6S33_005436 [Morchella sextelata]|uniref:uncharacterized protein n=1 Tax=Morchella sextelata TaxID=1174677 RepID=UPI001D0373AA|nr:uncharacterized protein H6S33_005436 [Morchella sextelata]KAH0613550.1 hypothetical protein H6S33_005436 [Morchella sextelata]